MPGLSRGCVGHVEAGGNGRDTEDLPGFEGHVSGPGGELERRRIHLATRLMLAGCAVGKRSMQPHTATPGPA